MFRNLDRLACKRDKTPDSLPSIISNVSNNDQDEESRFHEMNQKIFEEIINLGTELYVKYSLPNQEAHIYEGKFIKIKN